MLEDIRELVGRNIRRLSLAAGITQAQLSDHMWVDRSYVSDLELGQCNAMPLTPQLLADALQTSPKMFFEEKPGRAK